MSEKMKSAIHLREAQLFLDECIRTHEPVSLTALKKDGTRLQLDGWNVLSSWWTHGTHDLKNPLSGQIRKVRDILIFNINGHPVYI